MADLPVHTLMDILRNCPPELLQQEAARRTKLREKAKDDILFKHYKTYYTEHPEQYLYKDLDEADVIPIVEEGYRNSIYAWITINMDETKFNAVAVTKLLLKKPFKYVRRWIAVFEYYTGNPEHVEAEKRDSHHPHIHMLIEKTPEQYTRANLSKVTADFFRRFKSFVSGEEKIDVKMPKNPNSKISYLRGKKKEQYKKINSVNDAKWRTSLGLLHEYGNWEQIGPGVGLVGPACGAPQVPQATQATPATQGVSVSTTVAVNNALNEYDRARRVKEIASRMLSYEEYRQLVLTIVPQAEYDKTSAYYIHQHKMKGCLHCDMAEFNSCSCENPVNTTERILDYKRKCNQQCLDKGERLWWPEVGLPPPVFTEQ